MKLTWHDSWFFDPSLNTENGDRADEGKAWIVEEWCELF
jgi:hypothetical protein